MAGNTISDCVNGELRAGDMVVSDGATDYAYLVGAVTEIQKLGTPEHDTDNEADDVHVRFDSVDYSERRVKEIETAFGDLYGEPKAFDDLPMDDVIMPPDTLINLTVLNLSNEEFRGLLNSEEQAAAFCRRVLAEREAEKEPLTQKLYSPVFVELGAYDEEGDYSCGGISQKYAAEYFSEIQDALLSARRPKEAERGIMTYYHDGDGVNDKVRSLFVDVEVHDGKLWGATTLELSAPLTTEEFETLKMYIIGQYADGFGEGFGQHEIETNDGNLYVNLWDSSDTFYIETEQAFAQRLGIITPNSERQPWIIAPPDNAGRVDEQGARDAPEPVPGEPYGGSVVGEVRFVEKLYSPLEFYLHDPREEEENDEYGMYDLYDDNYKISHDEAWEHLDAIELTLRRECDRLDGVHGLAEYLPAELREKVWSIFPTIEPHGDALYFAATLELTATLTPKELSELKDWWSGQLSDGFGEGLEQREIKVGREELYIVPWTSDDGVFFIDMQTEFDRRFGIAPTEKIAINIRETSETDKSAQTRDDDLPDLTGKGYVFAIADNSDFYIPDALHVERDDSMMLFASDADAAAAAKRDGVPLIEDMDGVPEGIYVDTPENRDLIEDWQEDQDLEQLSALVDQLHGRLDANFKEYRSNKLTEGARAVFDGAEEIAAVCQSYEYYRNEVTYTAEKAQFLLKFKDPLDVVSDRWLPGASWQDTERAVFGDKAHILKNGGYELAEEADGATEAAQPKLSRATADKSGYTSVLTAIERDKQEKRDQPPAPRDKSRRKCAGGEEI